MTSQLFIERNTNTIILDSENTVLPPPVCTVRRSVRRWVSCLKF